MFPAYHQPAPLLVPGIIQQRGPLNVLLLGFFTCGVYLLYWFYITTDELRIATNDETLNPGLDLLLLFATCGIWGLYVEYRNAQKIHRVLLARDPLRKDQSQAILMLNIAAYFVGVTGFIATYLLQEELNALVEE